MRHALLPPPHASEPVASWARLAPAIVLVGWLAGSPAAARLVVMHGPAELASATLWIQTDAPAEVAVSWRVDGETSERSIALATTDATENVVVARLSGMKPGAGAAWRVRAGADVREGSARAQPFWTGPAGARELTFALGSCYFLADADPSWPGGDYGGGYGIFDAIAAQKPDVMLWLGDNVYLQQPDFFDPASMAERYRRQRAFEPLQRLLTATTHLAIWDDHDYGPNDGDGSYTLKGETLRLFRRYWPNPAYGLPEVAGAFGAARYGDVQIFLLDDRYYRSPNRWPDGPDKTMFGAAQLQWLKHALVSAPARSIKLVAGGSQFLKRQGRFEGWHHFATERAAFHKWLAARKIDGVVFLSGDRHFTELLKIERPGAYPLYEFTSSPLTSRTPPRLDAADRDNPDVVPGTQVVSRQFGIIRIGGPGNDRRLAFESYDGTGSLLWRHEVRASDLRHAASRATPP